MWSQDTNRLALLELYNSGELRLRRDQEEAWTWLAQLPWTRRTGRKNVLSVAPGRNEDIKELLTNIWPEWREVLQRFTAAGLPVNEQGWRKLCDLERAADLMMLPSRLNQRTAAALAGPHSKASISGLRRQMFADVDTTRDGIVRMRPNPDLMLEYQGDSIKALFLKHLTGEVILTERALRDGTKLAGRRPRGVLLVENLGPYLDLRAPDNWLVAHVPGWNTATIRLLLDQLHDITVAHFGDLDPNGVRISKHLQSVRPDIRWVVPEFWKEYLKRALQMPWPPDLSLDDAPPFVRELARTGLWLEQETIALDERLQTTLTDLVGDASTSAFGE